MISTERKERITNYIKMCYVAQGKPPTIKDIAWFFDIKDSDYTKEIIREIQNEGMLKAIYKL